MRTLSITAGLAVTLLLAGCGSATEDPTLPQEFSIPPSLSMSELSTLMANDDQPCVEMMPSNGGVIRVMDPECSATELELGGMFQGSATFNVDTLLDYLESPDDAPTSHTVGTTVDGHSFVAWTQTVTSHSNEKTEWESHAAFVVLPEIDGNGPWYVGFQESESVMSFADFTDLVASMEVTA